MSGGAIPSLIISNLKLVKDFADEDLSDFFGHVQSFELDSRITDLMKKLNDALATRIYKLLSLKKIKKIRRIFIGFERFLTKFIEEFFKRIYTFEGSRSKDKCADAYSII